MNRIEALCFAAFFGALALTNIVLLAASAFSGFLNAYAALGVVWAAAFAGLYIHVARGSSASR